MSAAPWTPGPWSVVTSNGYPSTIRADHVSAHAPGAIRDITRWASISMPSSAEGQANARLIAAAPEMAEALMGTTVSLIAAISLLERGGKKAAPSDRMFAHMLSDYQKRVDEARALLSRIRGDAP